MALVLNDRVRETTTTTGTGAVALGGAVSGFETFAAGIGNSNTVYYAIVHRTAAEFEVGLGTYASAGNTLTRTTVLASSNAGSAVNLSAGTKDVFVTYPADKSVYLDAAGDLTVTGGLTATNLELEGTDDSILTLRSTDDGPLYMEFERSTDRHAYLGFGGSNDVFAIWNEESGGDVQFGTNNTERLRIDSAGTAQFKNAIEEQQYSLTGTAIDPSNGTIQYKTLSANTTFTESLADGEYVTLMINDGAGYTITWPTTTWVGGSAPTLETTGYNVIELWHVNGTLYGAFVGAA